MPTDKELEVAQLRAKCMDQAIQSRKPYADINDIIVAAEEIATFVFKRDGHEC